jgi:hypothetical protein
LLEKIGQKLRCFFGVVAYWLHWLLHLKALYFVAFSGIVALSVARTVALKSLKVARCAGVETQRATLLKIYICYHELGAQKK